MAELLVLDSQAVAAALPMAPLIAAMKTAYAAVSNGTAVAPMRTHLPLADRGASALFMPAFVPGEIEESLAVKVVTLFPTNPIRGLPLIHAAVLVMDPETGEMLALLEGSSLTALRTGAGAGAATDLLARPDAETAAVFGAGAQARTQLKAVCAVREIRAVRVFGPTPANVRAFIEEMSAELPADYLAAGSPAEALSGADIVCTATTSTTPVFSDAEVPNGAHINAVGSYTPEMIELPPETLARARLTVDSRAACEAEAGELIRAVDLGIVDPDRIDEIGEIVLGAKLGRASADEITLFKSVGIAAQDAAAAGLALRNAREFGLGVEVNW
jgi:ornithine cyclodeaminase